MKTEIKENPSKPARKAYNRPRLAKFGGLRAITRDGGRNNVDAGDFQS